MIIAAVFWLLTALVVAVFVGRAWFRDRFRPKSRGHLVRSGVDAVVMLALVRALFPPPGWGSWLWVAAAVGVGVGVAGVIVGWRELPPGRRRWPTLAYAVVGAGLVAVLA